jgi:uncharacterized protein YprB with RNaseH-like and TPR domain
MLEATYIHCPGVGEITERRLWQAGARTWAEFIAMGERLRLSAKQRSVLEPLIAESQARLCAHDHAWFARHLPAREHWRAFPAFRDRIAFLDIETTGGLEPYDLTLVGLYDGTTLRQFVRGRNLNEFPEAVRDRALLVTFFGTGFDLPFLRRAFRMEFPQLHVDLCFLLKRLGYSGGLKQVERDFGIRRSAETDGLSGWDAVRLWNQWRRGDGEALDTLLAYNAEDVLNMQTLLDAAYPIMLAKTLGTEEGCVKVVG